MTPYHTRIPFAMLDTDNASIIPQPVSTRIFTTIREDVWSKPLAASYGPALTLYLRAQDVWGTRLLMCTKQISSIPSI